MTRVLIVGSGPDMGLLCRLHEAMGHEVKVCTIPDRIRGASPSSIIVDDVLDGIEKEIVDGLSPACTPAGLLASMSGATCVTIPRKWPTHLAAGNERPYLKRKKGRGGPGRKGGMTAKLNSIAKHRNPA